MNRRNQAVSPLLDLRALPALAGISSVQLGILARETEEIEVRAGNLLRSQSEPAEAVHVVTSGRFRLTRGSQSWIANPGDTIGFLEVLAGELQGTDVTAEVDASAISIDGDVLRNAAERYTPILIRLLEEVAGRVAAEPDILLSAIRGADGTPARAPGMDRVSRLLALHHATSLPSGSMDALAELAGQGVERHIPKGASLWLPGTPATTAFVICAGEVEYRTGSQVVGRLGPGSVPGLPLMLAGGVRYLEAVAVSDVIVLEVEREGFLDILEDNFELAWGILAGLAGRLVASDD